MSQVKVQYQTPTGWWITAQYTSDQPTNILTIVKSVRNSYPNSRVRVVDMNEKIVDIYC
jgi:hypothetical protein